MELRLKIKQPLESTLKGRSAWAWSNVKIVRKSFQLRRSLLNTQKTVRSQPSAPNVENLLQIWEGWRLTNFATKSNLNIARNVERHLQDRVTLRFTWKATPMRNPTSATIVTRDLIIWVVWSLIWRATRMQRHIYAMFVKSALKEWGLSKTIAKHI